MRLSSSCTFHGLSLILAASRVVAEFEGTQHPLGFASNNTNGCEEACIKLVEFLDEGDRVYFETFTPTLLTYFSARQSDVSPRCLVVPKCKEDVAAAMKVIGRYDCPFAAKSGGHAMFSGASSAPDGITIDLKNFDAIELDEKRTVVRLGPANTWGRVYSYLDALNLTVVGGRVGSVGVGGTLLGGGVSYTSRRWGWGADNVLNFEIVLANGTISNANFENSSDLYWALRGGGAGFGIVTHFDVETHPQGITWGDFSAQIASDVHSRAFEAGSVIRPLTITSKLRVSIAGYITSAACLFGYCSTVDEYVEKLWTMLKESSNDLDSHCYGVLSLTGWGSIVGFHMTHAAGNSDVVSFREARKGRKILSNPRVETGWAGFANDMSKMVEDGKSISSRVSFSTLTFRNPDLELIKRIYSIYIEVMYPLSVMGGTVASLPVQLITSDDIKHMEKRGGNPLGLKVEDCPLVMIDAAFGWTNQADDEKVMGTIQRLIERLKTMAKENDQFHPFLYQNYASDFQDVFAAYGQENRDRLRGIQKKYDPMDVFHRLQAGYFKV